MKSSMTVNLPASPASNYPIWIENGLLNKSLEWLPTDLNVDHWVIITDDHVKPIYGEALLKALKKQGKNALLISFQPGEASKNRNQQQKIEEEMFQHGCGRQTLILALGGGVT